MNIPVTLSLLFIVSCQSPERVQNSQKGIMDEDRVVVVEYPDELRKVLEKHGGLDVWKKMQSLTFEIVKESGNEARQTC